jgi:hypothetical protein
MAADLLGASINYTSKRMMVESKMASVKPEKPDTIL